MSDIEKVTPANGQGVSMDELEEEIRQSRFQPWEAESFLIKRHQARIDALTKPENSEGWWLRAWRVTKEVSTVISAYIGFLAIMTMAGHWLVAGSFLPKNEPCFMLSPAPPAVIDYSP